MLLDWIILVVVLVLFGTFAIAPLFDKWGDPRHGSWIIPRDGTSVKGAIITVLNTILTCAVLWIVVEWFLIMFCYQKGWLLPWLVS